MKNCRVALAFVSGYLFGRGHKGTLILGLAGLAAGKRLSSGISPPGAEQLKSSEFGKLGQEIGGRLVTVGREAAMSAASRRMDALSDRLEQRASTLRTGGAESQEPAAGEHEEPAAGEHEEPDEREEREEREPRERTGKQQRKPADRPAQARKRTGSDGPARRSQR
ncbi:hypothetical protein SSPO_017320 [Streptomyces antimycoticus]|uniref:DNA primase n=1 Tax=Streptomyces antimycoticus TaxID=68175 RepID=A0A499UD09_9ACTN|nr:hypothetical protein [Streptomyces antimycoticus]BBJ39014.1 hypothetical protein SSPO_017320 [Streptomyces antimycoticus]